MFGCTVLTVQAKGVTPTADVPPTNAKAKKADVKSTASTTDKDKAKTVTASTPAPKQDTTKSTVAKTSDKPTSSSRPTSISVASSRGTSSSHSSHSTAGEHLARVTAYWAGEGDYYTGKCMSSTGIHLHNGHCAVDPRIIPYGSTVDIAGVGKYLAVDTGSAVISREAAKECARTPEERNALVIDVFFESRRDGERFANSGLKYAAITWTSPRSTASTQDAGSMTAE
jgi:3D (Asp-Asp-Asp) domain-containing protein